MRLLDTNTGQFVEGADPKTKHHDRDPIWMYAILSHTWDTDGEQTYQQLKKIQLRYAPELQAPQSRPISDPRGGPSSFPPQDHGDPLSPSPPSQSPCDSPSATPLLAPSTPPKSWLARKTARLRMWCQRRSAPSAPKPSGTNPPMPPTSPPTAFGRLTQPEVDALFHAFGEAYGLTSPSTPAPASSSDPSTQSQEHQATQPPRSIWDDPHLSPKIRDACAVARKNGYRYIWIDSCCIDKSSSSELSEAINSMYKWYSLARVCYAYLADVPPGDDCHAEHSRFRLSRWFTRGWTLQELLAPARVEFLSKDWAPIGSKHAFVNLVESVTNIDGQALLCVRLLEEFSVAQRLSWAAKRETTREEDRAYSLLGIFDINMPTLYGEGKRAFQRLQEQIMQRIPDQSLFAWGIIYLPGSQLPSTLFRTQNQITFTACPWRSTPLASSSNAFQDGRNIRRVHLPTSHRYEILYTFTPYGIRAEFQMIPLTRNLLSAIVLPHDGAEQVELEGLDDSRWYLAILGCQHMDHPGHLLGRVCYIPSSKSEVDFMYPGYIDFDQTKSGAPLPDLFPLSPEIIERFRPHTELKAVYSPHPESDDLIGDPLWVLRRQPHTAIKLVLLTKTRDALRSRRGYTADLRDDPDPADHCAATHRLTLSKDERTIVVELQHALNNGGGEFTINAVVKMSMSGSHDSDSAPDSGRVDHRTVSWSDSNGRFGWDTKLGSQMVELTRSTPGTGTLTVDLGLDFAGAGVYFVQVDVRSDAPAAHASPPVESALPVSGSAVESAGDKGREAGLSGDDSPSGALDTEDWEAGREAAEGGCEVAPGDSEAATDEAGDGDRGST